MSFVICINRDQAEDPRSADSAPEDWGGGGTYNRLCRRLGPDFTGEKGFEHRRGKPPQNADHDIGTRSSNDQAIAEQSPSSRQAIAEQSPSNRQAVAQKRKLAINARGVLKFTIPIIGRTIGERSTSDRNWA